MTADPERLDSAAPPPEVVAEARRLTEERAKIEADRKSRDRRESSSELVARLLASVRENVPSSADEDAQRLAELEADRAKRERAARRRHVDGSGISVDDAALDLIVRGELDDTVRAYRIVDAWIDVHEGRRQARAGRGPGRWLVLSGTVGCGKTTAAAWAIARLGGLHAFAALLADAKTSRWAPDRELYARCVNARLLVVDDVGAGGDPDRERAMLEHVLDARQRAPALTVLTTNLERAEFDKRLGGRLVSRFALQGTFALCKGSDLRTSRRAK